jgi:hypothetical protein
VQKAQRRYQDLSSESYQFIQPDSEKRSVDIERAASRVDNAIEVWNLLASVGGPENKIIFDALHIEYNRFGNFCKNAIG